MYDERRLNKRRDADEIRSRVRAHVEALPMNLVFAIGFDVHGLNPRDEINCHCPVGRHMVNWRLQCNLEGGVAGKGTSEFCEKAGIMTPMGLMGHLITLKEQGSALHYATYEYLQYLYADHNGGFGHKALYKKGDAKYQKVVAAEKKDQERMKKSLIQERDEARRKAAQLEIENEQHKEELEELKKVSFAIISPTETVFCHFYHFIGF